MNSITKDDFLKMVRLQHLEVITQSQLSQNTQIIKSYMEKSLVSELSDIEKSDANMMIEEVGSLQKWEVMRDDFTKAICYTRPEQVQWEEPVKGEFGEIIKAKGGVYKPTSENKKLGRVGQKYGEKEDTSPKDHSSLSGPVSPAAKKAHSILTKYLNNTKVSNLKITHEKPDGSMNVTADTEDGKMSFGIDKDGKVQRTGMSGEKKESIIYPSQQDLIDHSDR